MIDKLSGDGVEVICPFQEMSNSIHTMSPKKLNIVFFGCHGKGNIGHGKLIKEKLDALNITPNFFLLNGDNFYDAGVEDENSSLFKSCFEEPYAKIFTDQFFFPILGNHDYGDFFIGGVKNLILFKKNRASPRAQINYSSKSKNWYMPGVYYSIKEKNNIFEFFCIDSNTIFFDEEQKKWLKDKVLNSNASWKILVCHQPVVTNGAHAVEPDVIALNNYICDEFQNTKNPKLKFNLFISAHEHNNQVLLLTEDSFQFIVGNCSSKNPSSVNKKQNTLYCSFDQGDFSFVLLTIDHDNFECKIIGNKSNYDFNYNKNKNYRNFVSPIQFKYPDLIKNSQIIEGNIYFSPNFLDKYTENYKYLHSLKIEVDNASEKWNQNSRLEWYAQRYIELNKIDSLLEDSKQYVKKFNILTCNLPWLELWKVVENLYVLISDTHFYCLKIMEDHEMKNKPSKRRGAINDLEESIYKINQLFYIILHEFYGSQRGNKPHTILPMRKIDLQSQAVSDLYKFEAYCNRCRIKRGYKTLKKIKFKVGHKGKDY